MINKKTKINLKNAENPFKTIWRILLYVIKYKYMLFFVILGMLISNFSTISITYFLKNIIDNYLVNLSKNYDILIYKKFLYSILIMLIVLFSECFFTYIYTKLMIFISLKTLYNIRKDLFNKMESLPISFFEERTRGEIMSLYTNDLNVIKDMLTDGFANLFSCILRTISLLFVMISYSWILTLINIVMLFLIIKLSKFVSKKMKEYFKQLQEQIAKLNGFIEEIFNGEKVVKVFSNETNVKNKFDTLNDKFTNITIKSNTYTNILGPIMLNLSNLNYLVISIIGIILISKKNISVGVFIAFLHCLKQFIMPVRMISQQLNGVLSGIAGAERVFKVIDMNKEIDDGYIKIFNKNNEYFYKDKKNTIKIEGKINFNNVSFKYKNNKENILNNINLKIKSKQKIAFIGSTGAGKTTITNLINRFYEIDNGSITIDDIDIKNIKKNDLRSIISIVPQDINLFSTTIMENIRYSKMDATDNKIIEASKLSNADSFIQHLPNKYKTILSLNANDLSQGERQLIAITRAIIANRPILILDEATSSIDTRTEKLIEDSLNNLIKDKTVIIIAHRLSTVKNCDKIYVLDKGKIIESGNHNELLNQKGKYYQFYNGIEELD